MSCDDLINICIKKGVKRDLLMTVKDTLDAIVDYSGHTAIAEIRRDRASDETIDVLTTENGRITLSSTAPNVSLYWSTAQTEALNFNTAYLEVDLINASGETERRVELKLTLSK